MTDLPPPRSLRPLRLVAPTAPGRVLLPWLLVGVAGSLAYYFREILLLVAAAFAVAYLLDPLVARLEARRVPRPLAIAAVLLGLGVVSTLVAWFVIPDIVREMSDLVVSVPRRLRDEWIPHANHLLAALRTHYRLRIPVTADAWLAQAGVRSDEIAQRSLSVMQSAAGLSLSILERLLDALIVCAMAFYLLLDYHRLLDGILVLVPRRAEAEVSRIAGNVNDALGRYVRGQALAMLILGTLFSAGLGVLGVPAGVGLGIIAGLLSVVPYLGFFIALATATLLAVLQGHVSPLAVVGYMTFVHIVDIGFVTPRIVGGSVGISPVWVIVSLLAGGKLGGFVGLLAAVPVASVLHVLFAEGVAFYRQTVFYTAVPAADSEFHGLEIGHVEAPVAVSEAPRRASQLPIDPLARSTVGDGTPKPH